MLEVAIVVRSHKQDGPVGFDQFPEPRSRSTLASGISRNRRFGFNSITAFTASNPSAKFGNDFYLGMAGQKFAQDLTGQIFIVYHYRVNFLSRIAGHEATPFAWAGRRNRQGQTELNEDERSEVRLRLAHAEIGTFGKDGKSIQQENTTHRDHDAG